MNEWKGDIKLKLSLSKSNFYDNTSACNLGTI